MARQCAFSTSKDLFVMWFQHISRKCDKNQWYMFERAIYAQLGLPNRYFEVIYLFVEDGKTKNIPNLLHQCYGTSQPFRSKLHALFDLRCVIYTNCETVSIHCINPQRRNSDSGVWFIYVLDTAMTPFYVCPHVSKGGYFR